MAIHFTTGSVLEATTEAVINTVNCVGVMGKGIALDFKNKHPNVFKAYTKECKNGVMRPGHIQMVPVKGFSYDFVINFPTKRHWRDNSRIDDIKLGLKSLAGHIRMFQLKSIAIPPLGCGNGGLDWANVKPIIVKALKDLTNVDIYIYEPVVQCIRVVNKHHSVPYDTFIGRGSKWGNPFTHLDGTTAKFKVKTRDEAVSSHRKWLLKQPELLMQLHELKGQTLCCYCDPQPCHGHTIRDLVEDTFYLVIAGSRGFNDYALLQKKADQLLRKVKRQIIIVSGRAPGADRLGEQYAKDRGYEVAEFPADWKGLGKKAGILRNEDMADFAKSLRGGALLFWDGASPGTKHMQQYCRNIHLQTFVETF